jgi:hypothetical protein
MSFLTICVGRLQDLLGGNFFGAYLQGSFAIGGFDPYTDVDFLIVIAIGNGHEDWWQPTSGHLGSQAFRIPVTKASNWRFDPRKALRSTGPLTPARRPEL